MSQRVDGFALLDRFQDIEPFLDEVIAAADENKNALGFYAASVFREFARSETLYVCAEKRGGNAKYAGHLLFSCRYPKASVLQIFVQADHRGHGVAMQLLLHLKSTLTHKGFISIYARVAEDLVDANLFWERQGFYVQRVAQGGAARKRTILVRSHELVSPQLFASSGFSSANPLGLEVTGDVEMPLFLLDLNVLFDLGPRRMRHDDALDLFRAERIGLCRFAISEELSNELKRTTTAGRTDPVQAYTRIFPAFPHLDTGEWKNLFGQLASFVFPGKEIDSLTENDKSDLRHLETAIQHRLAGFITNDTAILNASVEVKERYGIQVVSPIAFKQTNSEEACENAFETPSAGTISLSPIAEPDEGAVYALLAKLDISGSSIASEWAVSDSGRRVSSRYGAWTGNQLLGYLSWPAWNPNGVVVARIAIDEAFPLSLSSVRALLSYLIDRVAASGPTQIKIEFPQHQVYVREVAAGLGFSGTSNQAELCKLVLGRVVTPGNWAQCQKLLATVGRLRLPETPPEFRTVSQHVPIHSPNGNRVHIPLDSLETLLSPALFCLPSRGAVITPVQRDFSEHLLGHLPQKSLLPQSRVALFRERHYLSSSRTLKHFRRGGLILFYESVRHGGLGAIVAIARTKQVYLKPREALQAEDLDPSVLDPSNIEAIGRSKMKTVTIFDNVIPFRHPVPLETLRRIGCGKSTDLLTTHPITDEQFQAILSEGIGHE